MTTTKSAFCDNHFAHCPIQNAPKGAAHKMRLCPNHVLDVDVHCFKWCDMASDARCGECQHWAHHNTRLDNGSCFFYGDVRATQRVDCPRHRVREEGSLDWTAWVERQTKALAGRDLYEADPDSPEVRGYRRQARADYRSRFDY